MPIIVNEFEILPEPSGEQQLPASTGQPSSAVETPIPDPWTLQRVERVAKQRRRRLWAD